MKSRKLWYVVLLIAGTIALNLTASNPPSAAAQRPQPNSPRATGGPDAFGYKWDDGVAYNWTDATTGTDAGLVDDDAFVGPVSIGFNFGFYENTYSQLYISTNGYVSFGSGSSFYNNVNIPTADSPNNFIAPLWDDLAIGAPYNSGKVYYMSGGTLPNRYFVIEWWNITAYCATTCNDFRTFEVILNENGDIVMQYYAWTGSAPTATIGIEDSTGARGLQYPYAAGALFGKAVRFYPTTVYHTWLPIVISSNSTLGTPILLTPNDEATIAKTVFDWTDVPGATGYQFQLSNSNTFNAFIINQAVASSQFAYTSNLNGTYYWRVYATNGGNSGTYSAVRALHLVDYNGDDDGDALKNGWELHGYDYNNDGVIDVDLPALGANYRHKDIFVQMDYMFRASATCGLAPNQNVINSIIASFNNAPVSNPDGINGINIHLELANQVPWDGDLNPVYNEFYAIKNLYFNPNRSAIYHYMIWADRYNGGTSSGLSMNIPATDFIVTLGGWSCPGGTDFEKIGTFIHELGHNLGLRHGGNDDTNYKPNYLSVMNYLFQTYGVYRNGNSYFDYQRFGLPSLNESNLNESAGLNSAFTAGYWTLKKCPLNAYWTWTDASGAIDWNCNGVATEFGISVDLNNDSSLTTLGSQDNWANIVFNGGGIIGSGLSPQQLAARIRAAYTPLPFVELTWEQQAQMNARTQNKPR